MSTMEIQILEILSCNVWDAQFLTIHTSLNSKKDIFVYAKCWKIEIIYEKENSQLQNTAQNDTSLKITKFRKLVQRNWTFNMLQPSTTRKTSRTFCKMLICSYFANSINFWAFKFINKPCIFSK